MKKIRKVVFPVGGLGTRFLPATKSVPKEMMTIVSKPLIHYAFEEAVAAGAEQFIFVTTRNKEAIERHFDHAYELEAILKADGKEKRLSQTRDWLPDPGNVIVIRQQEPAGLGHAIWCARHVVGDEPFAVILPDDIVQSDTACLKQLVDAHDNEVPGTNMAAVMEVPKEETDKYGILKIEENNGKLARASDLVEKPKPENAPSNLSIIGRYVLQPKIFEILDHQKKGAGGEIQITDAMKNAIPEVPFYGFRFDGTRYDCGNHSGFVEANIAFALADPELRPHITKVLKRFCEGL